MWGKLELSEDDRAISPVIGVILMVAIVIILSGVVGVSLLSIQPPEDVPSIGTTEEFETEYNASTGTTKQYLEVRHIRGDRIPAEDLKITLSSESKTVTNPTLETSDGTFRSGAQFRYNVTDANFCETPDSVVDVQIIDKETGTLLKSTKAEIVRPDPGAQIADNQVKTEGPFQATVTIVGLEVGVGDGDNIKGDAVHGRVSLTYPNGTTEYRTPWPDGDASDSLDTSSPSGVYQDDIWKPTPTGYTYTTDELPPGTKVGLDLRAYKPGDWTDSGKDIERLGNSYDLLYGTNTISSYRFWVNSADPSDTNLIPLQNGDTIPDYGNAYPRQKNLTQMLNGSRSGDTVQLSATETVFIYELSRANAQPSDTYADFNDAVGSIEFSRPEPSTQTSLSLKCAGA